MRGTFRHRRKFTGWDYPINDSGWFIYRCVYKDSNLEIVVFSLALRYDWISVDFDI